MHPAQPEPRGTFPYLAGLHGGLTTPELKMPILLWLLGVPISMVILLLLIGVV